MIRPSVTISARDLQLLEERVTEKARAKARRIAQRAADEMVDEIENLIASEVIPDRPARRRRNPGSIHLINSFEGVVVEGDGNTLASAVLRPKAGADKDKIRYLEHGTNEHWIPAGDAGLAFPKARDIGDPSNPARNAYGGKPTFWTPDGVYHPGNRAYRFMRRARDRVARRIG